MGRVMVRLQASRLEISPRKRKTNAKFKREGREVLDIVTNLNRSNQGVPRGLHRNNQGVPRGLPRNNQGVPRGLRVVPVTHKLVEMVIAGEQAVRFRS